MRAKRKKQKRRLLHYSVAVLSVALALGLTLLLLAPWLYPTVTPLFFVAVMVSAWVGGWEAGLLAALLSTLAVSYFFIQPLYSWQVVNVGSIVRLGMFAIAAGLIHGLNQSRHKTLRGSMEREAVMQAEGAQAKQALRQSEAQQVFLLQLNDHLRFLVDPEAIQFEAARLLGERLGADRVGYAEDQGDGETIIVTRNYTNGVPGIEGRYRYADYGAALLRELRAGRTMIRPDIAHDPTLTEAEKEAHAILQLGATVNVPLVKAGRLIAVLFLHYQEAHSFSEDELALLAAVAERTWDAVERARAEASLRESEAKYRSLFDSIDEGVCLFERLPLRPDGLRDYRYVAMNPAMQTMFGIPDLSGQSIRDNFPDEVEDWYNDYDRVLETGQSIRFERETEPQGMVLEMFVTRIEDGSKQRLLAVMKDVTERKRVEDERQRAEAALRASEEKYRTLFETIDEGYCLVEIVRDEDGHPVDMRYLEVNRVFEQQTGLHDVVGKTHADLGLKTERHWFEKYWQVTQTGESTRFESYHQPTERWYNVFVSRVDEHYDDRVALVFNDITESKHNEQRQAYLLQLSDALRSLWDAVEIYATVTRIALNFFGADRCYYCEIIDGNSIIRQDASREDLPSIAGAYPLSDFPIFKAVIDAGRPLVVEDAHTTDVLDEPLRQLCCELQVISFIDVPVIKEGKPAGVLCITQSTPRNWTALETELAQETAERIWAAVKRARTEAALRESEENYRSLFNSINDGFCVIELLYDEQQQPVDYLFLEVNATFERQSGLSGAVGKTGLYFAPNHEPEILANYHHAVVTGKPIDFEVTMADLGRSFRASANRHGDPQKRQVVITFNDITERKRREANLAFLAEIQNDCARLTTADAMMQTIGAKIGSYLNLSICAFVDVDESQDEAIVHHNWHRADAPNLMGTYRISEFVSEAFYVAVRAGDMVIVNDTNTDARTHAESCAVLNIGAFIHVPLLRAGQWKFLFNGYDSRSRDWRQDEIELFRELANQVFPRLERARAEAEREQLLIREQAAREQADRANRIKDEFLAVLSHELRSPLNPILGWAKLLRQGRLDPIKTGQALQTIERNAQLQSELIEDLLDVSRILRGKLSLNVAPVNLGVVVRSAMETVRLAAQAKAIDVQFEVSDGVREDREDEREISSPPSSSFIVQGDATRLQQVVWNLLSNAVKFTSAGGHVTVKLESVDHDAQITVRDTGKGITPEFLPHIFDYFQQEDGTTTRKFGGLGLGLAIVRQLVELHGGSVWAESQGEGRGATFTVRLPLMPIQQSHDPAPTFSSGSFDLTGIEALVVDDEPDSRDFTAFVMEQAGASVKTAASGAEAIALLMQSQIDVLLSDVGMPEMDGYMLMQHIRKLPPEQNGQVKAIALTAYAGDFNLQQALQAGFQRHIAKPVEPQALVETIATLCAAIIPQER